MVHSDQHAIDVLFEVRNAFHMGNFQQCIKEAQKIKSTVDEETKLLRDVFMYRSYICQKKYGVILEEIPPPSSSSTPIDLQMLRLFALYLSSEHDREKVMVEIGQKIKSGSADTLNNIFCLIAAHIFIYEGDIENALKILRNAPDDLECEATAVQCLLKINRDDTALKQVKSMQEKDEDSILTQLALAWTNISLGREKLQDAFYILQEIIDKYGGTPLLLNQQSSVLIKQEKYEQADKMLQDAMEKDSNDPETLINLIVVARHLGKQPEITNRYINQLKDGFPNHPWTKEYLAKEKEFDRLCRQYEARKA